MTYKFFPQAIWPSKINNSVCTHTTQKAKTPKNSFFLETLVICCEEKNSCPIKNLNRFDVIRFHKANINEFFHSYSRVISCSVYEKAQRIISASIASSCFMNKTAKYLLTYKYQKVHVGSVIFSLSYSFAKRVKNLLQPCIKATIITKGLAFGSYII